VLDGLAAMSFYVLADLIEQFSRVQDEFFNGKTVEEELLPSKIIVLMPKARDSLPSPP
jgi:hypothetical protein